LSSFQACRFIGRDAASAAIFFEGLFESSHLIADRVTCSAASLSIRVDATRTCMITNPSLLDWFGDWKAVLTQRS
jgi:hypothetical protein